MLIYVYLHFQAFCCIPGTVLDRYAVSFNLVGPPCVQSLVLITLTALILYSPDFTFIFTHFTLLIAISSLFSLVNFLLLLPVLMTTIQPQCWLVGFSKIDPTLLAPLTPSPVVKRKSSKSSSGRSSSRSGGRSSRNNYPPPPYNLRGSNFNKGSYHSGRAPTSRTPSEHSLSTITGGYHDRMNTNQFYEYKNSIYFEYFVYRRTNFMCYKKVIFT